jgi:hypothetical protein
MRARRFVILLGVAVLCLFLTPRSPMAADADGVMMRNGKMMMMKDGKAMGPMQGDMTMSDGTKMMTDGTMMMKDGTKMQMKDGQTMTMDGKMMEGKMMEGGKGMGMGNQ